MKPIKLAVIGVGHLGRVHAELVGRLEDAELVAVVDPLKQVREQVAADTGAEPFADFRELLGRVDAAIVATPTETHHEIARELLDAGMHLLVEKPLAATLAEADDLVTAAARGGATLQVGHVERFNPALERVLPELEEPKYIEAVRTSGYPFRSSDIGVVLDLMIHDIDVVLALVRSPVQRIDALGLALLGDHEDLAQVRLEFESGCVANLTASRASYRAQRQMQVWTPRVFASVDFGMRETSIVRPSEKVLARRVDLQAVPAEDRARLRKNLFVDLLPRETIEGAEGNPLLAEQKDLVESITEGRPPRVTGEQGRDALALAERILAVIDAHEWDGDSAGRVGPFVMPGTPILRTHWGAGRDAAIHKEAG